MRLKKTSATNCTPQTATRKKCKEKITGVFQPDCPAYSSTGHLNPHDATEDWQQDTSLPVTERGKATRLLCNCTSTALAALLPLSFLTAM